MNFNPHKKYLIEYFTNGRWLERGIYHGDQAEKEVKNIIDSCDECNRVRCSEFNRTTQTGGINEKN